MRFFFSFLLIPFLFCWTGCSGGAKPEALKNLSPVTITVVDGGSPIEGVRVSLSSNGPRGAWGCSATTDTNGVARLQTTMSSKSGMGAPAGEYIVTLSKFVPLPANLEPQESDQDLSPQQAAAKEAMRKEFADKNRIIPEKLETSSGNPLALIVAEKTGAEMTVDISKYKQ